MSSNVEAIASATSVRARTTADEWEMRVQLAACYRLAAHYGWTDLIYTHISARVPGPDEHFLLNPFGFMFDEVTASNLVKVDLEGNLVDPTCHSIHKAGFIIHSAVHAARRDVKCVIHSHTRAGMAVSMMECGLLPLTQHAMLFYGRVGYHSTEGLALDLDERNSIVRDLGTHSILVLRNHGTLVAGSTVPQAFTMMWNLEKALQAQVDAMASGQKLTTVPREVAEETARLGYSDEVLPEYPEGKSPIGRLEWPALLRMLDRIDPTYRQ